MKGLKAKIRKYKATRWILILTNWVSQGIWHMDKTEQVYRVSFTIIFTFIFYIIITLFFNLNNYVSLLVSLIISHTVNWIVNSNLFTLFVHRLLIGETKKEDFFNYLEKLKERADKEDSIIGIYCYGSMSRGTLQKKSDLDISFLRKKGIQNAIRSIIFFTKEKKISQSLRVPTESFLCDKVSCLKKRYDSNEPPVIICDKKKSIIKNYNVHLSLCEAEKINTLV